MNYLSHVYHHPSPAHPNADSPSFRGTRNPALVDRATVAAGFLGRLRLPRNDGSVSRSVFAVAMAALNLLPGTVKAQETPKGQEPRASASAKAILQRTLAAYAAAKTYQGSWSYTIERGASKRVMNLE